eukprot:1142858-Pelagomonas_calceolata.AAC.3
MEVGSYNLGKKSVLLHHSQQQIISGKNLVSMASISEVTFHCRSMLLAVEKVKGRNYVNSETSLHQSRKGNDLAQKGRESPPPQSRNRTG